MSILQLVVVGGLAAAIVIFCWLLCAAGFRKAVAGLCVVAVAGVVAVTVFHLGKPLTVWVNGPSGDADVVSFEISEGKGLYEERTFYFDTALPREEVFDAFAEAYPAVTVYEDEAVLVDKEVEYRLRYDPTDASFPYALERVNTSR